MFMGLSYYFIIMDFLIYGFLGWIYESTFCSIKSGKPVNRGFLIGPLIPIYGFGGTLVYVFLRPLQTHPSLLFAGGMLLATVTEYITSYAMEKLFHAQWWDYSREPYNFQGRIALIPSMFWGFLTLLAFDFLQPAVTSIMHLIPEKAGVVLIHIVAAITCVDLVYTVITTINFRNQLENLSRIREELVELLEEGQFAPLKELLANTPGARSMSNTAEEFRKRISAIRESYTGEESRFSQYEARIRDYLMKHRQFQKKNRFFGNNRLVQAFPTMKFIPSSAKHGSREKLSFRVKDFLIQVSDKAKEELTKHK